MVKQDTNEVIYTEAWIAWLDTIGFSLMLSREENEFKVNGYFKDIFENLDAACADIKVGFEGVEEDSVLTQVRRIVFSDSILLFTFDMRRKSKLFEAAAHLQALCLKKKFPLRGAITHGKFSVGTYGATGPAFLRVVNLEKDVAVYPRIVIDPNLCEKCIHRGVRKRILQKDDHDGIWTVNGFVHLNDGDRADLTKYFENCTSQENWEKAPKHAMKNRYLIGKMSKF